ncbi:MAG: hypothetical protein P4L26_10430 [Terracidiphilus sp.]|nr:hypothetical protein [Terracidiphilus sp.]
MIFFAYFTARGFWDLFLHKPRNSGLLFPLNSILPMWTAVALNLTIYAFLLYLLVDVCRNCRGGERVLLSAWIGASLLGPLEILAPTDAAGIHGLQAAGMAVAFLGALAIYRKLPANSAPPGNDLSDCSS